MPTRSFTIAHEVVPPGVLTTVWAGNMGYTVLIKGISLFGWTGGPNKVELLAGSPAGSWAFYWASVAEYAIHNTTIWHALSPGMSIGVYAAGPGQVRVLLSGTLLPAGPGLVQAESLPIMPPPAAVTPMG